MRFITVKNDLTEYFKNQLPAIKFSWNIRLSANPSQKFIKLLSFSWSFTVLVLGDFNVLKCFCVLSVIRHWISIVSFFFIHSEWVLITPRNCSCAHFVYIFYLYFILSSVYSNEILFSFCVMGKSMILMLLLIYHTYFLNFTTVV